MSFLSPKENNLIIRTSILDNNLTSEQYEKIWSDYIPIAIRHFDTKYANYKQGECSGKIQDGKYFRRCYIIRGCFIEIEIDIQNNKLYLIATTGGNPVIGGKEDTISTILEFIKTIPAPVLQELQLPKTP
jgi:hypothetical protein